MKKALLVCLGAFLIFAITVNATPPVKESSKTEKAVYCHDNDAGGYHVEAWCTDALVVSNNDINMPDLPNAVLLKKNSSSVLARSNAEALKDISAIPKYHSAVLARNTEVAKIVSWNKGKKTDQPEDDQPCDAYCANTNTTDLANIHISLQLPVLMKFG